MKVTKRRDGTVIIHTDIDTARSIAMRCRGDVNPEIATLATEVNKKFGGVPAIEPEPEEVPVDEAAEAVA